MEQSSPEWLEFRLYHGSGEGHPSDVPSRVEEAGRARGQESLG